MPYIVEAGREILKPRVEGIAGTAGELNFQLTDLCLQYLNQNGKSYDTINGIVGALECAKLEFYRRLAAPYEDTKIAINGDVYP